MCVLSRIPAMPLCSSKAPPHSFNYLLYASPWPRSELRTGSNCLLPLPPGGPMTRINRSSRFLLPTCPHQSIWSPLKAPSWERQLILNTSPSSTSIIPSTPGGWSHLPQTSQIRPHVLPATSLVGLGSGPRARGPGQL